jgi:hypothetical protein
MLVIAVLLLAAGSTSAGDWPQWLGPNRDGSTPEIVAPWKDAPKVVWRAPVGEGHSSPVVAGRRVYLLDKVPGKDAERVRFWNALTGELGTTLVESPRGPFTSMFGTGPAATPAVTDSANVPNSVFAFGVTGNFYIRGTNASAGREIVFNLLERYQAKNLRFGVAASPLVEGDKVIVPVGGTGAGIVALNRADGELAWKALDDPASYAAPIALDHAGQREIVALTANGVAGLSAKDGAIFWQFPFKDRLQESSATPVKVGDLVIASSVTLGSVALKLTTKDGKPAVEEAWKNPNLNCYFSTPVAVNDKYVYMVTGSLQSMMTGRPASDLQCVDVATGKSLWKKERVGRYHAALVRTGDNKLLMLSDSGDLALLDPDPKEYRELARSKVCGETWAHPALVNGKLYLRDDKDLICLQLGN